MGARRHRQGGTCSLCKCYKIFMCISSYCTERSIDELCMHYLHYLSPFCRLLRPQTPPELHPWIPLGNCRSQTTICPPLEKNPKGAHGLKETTKPILCAYTAVMCTVVLNWFQVNFPSNRHPWQEVSWPQTVQREAFCDALNATKSFSADFYAEIFYRNLVCN